VPGDPHKLHLGKGVRFVKSELRHLPLSDDIWEADFLPTIWGGRTVWQGLVVTHDGCRPLRERMVEHQPDVNEMADLLSGAMLHPGDEGPRRPRTLHIRKRREWQELLPHLEQIGIHVIFAGRLVKWDRAFKEFCRTVLRSDSEAKPPAVKERYPAVAQFVRESGWIEIGDQQGVGFVARALDQGGLVFEDKMPRSLGEALAALERGLERDWPSVKAAIELPWSNGRAEGHVNRIKLIKRKMYGRANFDLLRIRVMTRGP
jgi:hypothetical protein